jgi:hypothetical protein
MELNKTISIETGSVRFATLKDLPYIIDLSKKESQSIGFIPKMAYESAITGIKKGDRWSDKCNDKIWVCDCNGDLVGFVLASFGQYNAVWKYGKIAQICLQVDARLMLRGKLLLDNVIEYAKIIYTHSFSCGCADDLPSNLFWQTMGWIKIGDRMGISHKNTWKQTSKRKVNIYRYDPYDLFLYKLV